MPFLYLKLLVNPPPPPLPIICMEKGKDWPKCGDQNPSLSTLLKPSFLILFPMIENTTILNLCSALANLKTFLQVLVFHLHN